MNAINNDPVHNYNQQEFKLDTDDFRALSGQRHTQSVPALMRALTRLFILNPAPAPSDISQFEELILQLIPMADQPTRQALQRQLSKAAHTPQKVLKALEEEPVPLRMPEQARPTVDRTQSSPNYTAQQLLNMLPLQISRAKAKAIVLAAQQGHRHSLRSLLAGCLKAPNTFVEDMLNHSYGFALAVGLKAIRMPREDAKRLFQALNEQSPNIDTLLNQFDRLEAHACHQKLLASIKEFLVRQAQPQYTTYASSHARRTEYCHNTYVNADQNKAHTNAPFTLSQQSYAQK